MPTIRRSRNFYRNNQNQQNSEPVILMYENGVRVPISEFEGPDIEKYIGKNNSQIHKNLKEI